jgi:pimeloyl-ACP methyl ester carboxylesterase
VVGKLRSGDYSIVGGSAPAYKKVALAGHSAGAEIANLEAHSFGDIDALIVISYSFQSTPPAAIVFGNARLFCQRGGEPSDPGGPGGYAYFGQSAADFEAAMFHRASRSVIEAATGLRNRDPCGDNASLIAAIQLERRSLAKVRAPVLLVCGTRDALFAATGCGEQRKLYTGSRDKSAALVRNAGHAVTLERTAPRFRRTVSRWLAKRGF